jgi:heptaprenyl diphosphate synthase
VEESIHKKLYLFGYYVGMAFQITDDILDFTSSEEELGKPAGSDLLQGNITAPAFYAMVDETIRFEIEKVQQEMEPAQIQKIITLIKESGAIEKSIALSDMYLDKALAVLEELPANKAKKTLRDIAKFIGRRKY